MTRLGLGFVAAIATLPPLSGVASAQILTQPPEAAGALPDLLGGAVPPVPYQPVSDPEHAIGRWSLLPDPREGPASGAEAANPPGASDAAKGRADHPEFGPYRLSTFQHQAGTVGWEMIGLTAALTATRFKDITKGGSAFHFKSEGWFGRKTESLGMDKIHHGWKTYVIADVLHSLVAHRTGNARGSAYTGSLLALGLLTYAEVLDGFTARTGFSNEDMVSHLAGAGLSLFRNTVPGLREKIDFRMAIGTQGLGKDLRLVDQLSDRKYLLATQLSGFRRFEASPLRFVELHLGYYGRGFSMTERSAGDPLRRRIFVGVGFNVQQLFSARPRSAVERLAKGAFDYIQLPYTSVRN